MQEWRQRGDVQLRDAVRCAMGRDEACDVAVARQPITWKVNRWVCIGWVSGVVFKPGE